MLRKQDPALGAPVHPADSSSVRPRNPAPPQCRSGTGASVIDFAATRRSLTPGNAKVGIQVGPTTASHQMQASGRSAAGDRIADGAAASRWGPGLVVVLRERHVDVAADSRLDPIVNTSLQAPGSSSWTICGTRLPADTSPASPSARASAPG